MDIFSAQNECLAIGYLMDTERFGFGPNLNKLQLFKEGTCQALMDNFAAIFPSNPCNLGLEALIPKTMVRLNKANERPAQA